MALNVGIAEADCLAATSYLHDLGSILHFAEEKSGLNEIVILDPQVSIPPCCFPSEQRRY